MKTEFLKSLGIEEQSVIDQIMAENGRDVSKVKGDLENYKTQIADLQKDNKAKDDTIATLQSQVGDVEKLNNEISDLKADKTKLETELNTKVSELQKGHAIEGAIRDAKGKNIKAIRALLDETKITYENGELGGITEQLQTLASAEDSSMLFGEAQKAPSGTHPTDPAKNGQGGNPPTSATFAEAVAKALNKN